VTLLFEELVKPVSDDGLLRNTRSGPCSLFHPKRHLELRRMMALL
jgi:hypothetical protein